MRSIKFLFIIFTVTTSILFAKTVDTKIFILPKDSRAALKEIYKKIDNAKYRIDAAIYSFTHKQIAKRLVNAARRGVKVRVVFDKEANLKNRRSQIGYLSKYKNIECFIANGKKRKRGNGYGLMHMKMMIIDNKTTLIGSANWSYSAFSVNHEILVFINDYGITKKMQRGFENILKYAKEY